LASKKRRGLQDPGRGKKFGGKGKEKGEKRGKVRESEGSFYPGLEGECDWKEDRIVRIFFKKGVGGKGQRGRGAGEK